MHRESERGEIPSSLQATVNVGVSRDEASVSPSLGDACETRSRNISVDTPSFGVESVCLPEKGSVTIRLCMGGKCVAPIGVTRFVHERVRATPRNRRTASASESNSPPFHTRQRIMTHSRPSKFALVQYSCVVFLCHAPVQSILLQCLSRLPMTCGCDPIVCVGIANPGWIAGR